LYRLNMEIYQSGMYQMCFNTSIVSVKYTYIINTYIIIRFQYFNCIG